MNRRITGTLPCLIIVKRNIHFTINWNQGIQRTALFPEPPTLIGQPLHTIEEQTAANICFHCGIPVPVDLDLNVTVFGKKRAMCCPGCTAVCNAIVDAGLEQYYEQRTEYPETPQDLVPEILQQTSIYDLDSVRDDYLSEQHGSAECRMLVSDIRCAACVWLLEQQLGRLPGIEKAQVNFANHSVQIKFDSKRTRIADIIGGIAKIGYRAVPESRTTREHELRKEKQQSLKRMGVAAALGMQVMLLAISMYAGLEEAMLLEFFRRLSLLLTLPIIIYSARPFFTSALRGLRYGHPGMDLPVSIAIALAFGASTWNTIRGSGEIWFDSVVMFVFFLSCARHLELSARINAWQQGVGKTYQRPVAAQRRNDDEHFTLVSAASLETGDLVRVTPGETIPADGVLLEGKTSVDESLLTGESTPRTRQPDDQVIGGSVNISQSILIRVGCPDRDSVLSAMQRLVDRGHGSKPRFALAADRLARWFVIGLLCIAGGVALYWFNRDAERWFEITLATLVVACPCALSLATPTALSAAIAAAQRLGLLICDGAVIERLNSIGIFVFDKTGTLTEGKMTLKFVDSLSTLDRIHCLQIAASLEAHSSHPIAHALCHANDQILTATKHVRIHPASGITGDVAGKNYSLGSRELMAIHCLEKPPADAAHGIVVWLADDFHILARFVLDDTIRSDATDLLKAIDNRGIQRRILSGDTVDSTRYVAEKLHFKSFKGRCSAAEKMQEIRILQEQGDGVCMVGDGVNDAPVLATADVGIAVNDCSQLAAVNADIILMKPRLTVIDDCLGLAKKTSVIVRQNFAWALLYNLSALPLAASGMIAPWMAAIGMSLSSLLVVFNALRLLRKN